MLYVLRNKLQLTNDAHIFSCLSFKEHRTTTITLKHTLFENNQLHLSRCPFCFTKQIVSYKWHTYFLTYFLQGTQDNHNNSKAHSVWKQSTSSFPLSFQPILTPSLPHAYRSCWIFRSFFFLEDSIPLTFL